jgi:hypothetical protein
VNEINFPYDIPNIQDGYNTFEIFNPDVSGLSLDVVIPPGFYSGTELADAVSNEIGKLATGLSQDARNFPTLQYSTSANRFCFLAPADPPPGNPNPTWTFFSSYTFPLGYTKTTNSGGRDILSIMGFLSSQAGQNQVSSKPQNNNPTFFAGASAPLVFTQYVDICSPQLCKFQDFAGGSTTDGTISPILSRRGDVVCRLYVSNNMAVQEQEGVRPFIINRQYVNARVMKWSTGNSIGQMDIQLYDDLGLPLQITWEPRSFQISFNVYEDDENESVHEPHVGVLNEATNQVHFEAPKKHKGYVPKNTRAWDNPNYPIRGSGSHAK